MTKAEQINKIMEVANLWASGFITRIDIQYNELTELYHARVWESESISYFDVKWTEKGLTIETH